MDIKVLNIRKSNFSSGATIAFVDLQIDKLLIDGFKIVNGQRGKFLSFPRQKGKDEKWYDIVKPVDFTTKNEIETYVLKEFEKFSNPTEPELPTE